jgi:hypothetical protein
VGNRGAKAREDEERVDSDVPAAVVCTRCGASDCAGCLDEDPGSGVVAVVPWERPGSPMLVRLWATARATTFDAERFFEMLPDGPLAPAFRFALASELIATASMGLLLVTPLAVLAPAWLAHALVAHGGALARMVVAGIPALAALLVAAHVAHGWALDRGARRSGARGTTTRAVRFGLYAAGWDLVIGPLGAIVVGLKEGLRPAISVAVVGIGLPGRSARAFLRGCYKLEGASAQPALRASYAAAVVATAVGASAVVAALIAALSL